MFELKDKTVVITGGGSWIGKAIAELYASYSSNVIIIGRTESKLKQTTDDITEHGGNCTYYVADVTSESELNTALSGITELHKQIDVLIHNAAIYPVCSIEEMNKENWKQVIDNNLSSAFYLLDVFLESIKKSPNGKIIYISSIAGELIGAPNLSHYAASKSGLNGFMRTAALELAKYNICVNSILPGNIINNDLFKVDEENYKKMLSAIPLRRTGKPEDVAKLTLFLGSDNADFITGQTFVIDGGESISPWHIA